MGRRDPQRNHRARLRDMRCDGRRLLMLENETLRVVVCPDKGSDILELLHKPTDTEMLYQAPAGLGSPLDRASAPLPEGHFRDRFPGGWYVMLPNGPEPCTHRGASFGHHGEATFLAWDAAVTEDRADRVAIVLRTRLRRIPLLIERRMSLAAGSATLVIEEAVTSEAGHEVELLWGHHPTFGAPLIEPGTRIDLPGVGLDDERATIPADDVVLHDFTRIDRLDAGWFAVSNDRRGAGVALRWDEALFPTLGVWRMLGGEGDYPWYGARRMVALEPACDLPSLAAAAARGTAIRLRPGERIATRIEATLFTPRGRVTGVDWGGGLQFGDKP